MWRETCFLSIQDPQVSMSKSVTDSTVNEFPEKEVLGHVSMMFWLLDDKNIEYCYLFKIVDLFQLARQ